MIPHVEYYTTEVGNDELNMVFSNDLNMFYHNLQTRNEGRNLHKILHTLVNSH
jgi:hypothetical protein